MLVCTLHLYVNYLSCLMKITHGLDYVPIAFSMKKNNIS
jgi:hypothetical protein